MAVAQLSVAQPIVDRPQTIHAHMPIEWHNGPSTIHCAGTGAIEGYKGTCTFTRRPTHQFSTMRQTRQSTSTSSAPKPTTPPSHPTPDDTTLERELTSAEINRRDELSNHPHIGWVKPHTVLCKLCAKEIALNKVSLYTPHNWKIHEDRKTHKKKIPKDKIQAKDVVAVESVTTRGKKRKRDSEVKVERVMKSRTFRPESEEDEVDDRAPDNDSKENQNPRKVNLASVSPKVPLVLPIRFTRKSYTA
ncbi:hypothetical protein CPB85DRAFT_1429197 [Mucidula mucida]|nr:hypothetical protein CPB85DRAFT_1429197 [Mucidula mucida]